MRGVSLAPPNGFVYSWVWAGALGGGQGSRLAAGEEPILLLLLLLRPPPPFGVFRCRAKCEFRGTERTDRCRMTRSTFSLQEVGSETSIFEGKSCLKGTKQALPHPCSLPDRIIGSTLLAMFADMRL